MDGTDETTRHWPAPEVWRPIFLRELERTSNVSKSARKAGVARGSTYRARDENPDFALAWDDALEVGIDAVEETAIRRAKAGSDALIQFILKTRRRATYGDRSSVQVGGTGEGGAILLEHRELPASVAALRDLTARLGLTMADVGPLLSASADSPPDGSTGAPPS